MIDLTFISKVFIRQPPSRGLQLSNRSPIKYKWHRLLVDKFRNTGAIHAKMLSRGLLKLQRMLP